MKYDLLLAAPFASPHTPRAFFAHCLLRYHLGKHYQQMSTMTRQNLYHAVRQQMLTLTLPLKYLSHDGHPWLKLRLTECSA